MSYWFRVRFNLAPQSLLVCDESRLVLNEPGSNRVVIGPATGDIDGPITGAKELSLVGQDYPNYDTAQAAARSWRDYLMNAFAELRIGSDFGDQTVPDEAVMKSMELSGPGLAFNLRQKVSQGIGRAVRNEVHGIEIFEHKDGDDPPVYFSVEATGSRPNEAATLIEKIQKAKQSGLLLSDRALLAHELYGSSFFQTFDKARFVTRVMAIESLIESQPRDSAVIKHVEKMIGDTRAAALPKTQKDSIIGSLKWLKTDSINQAGKRLVQCLGDSLYMNEAPAMFFTNCYAVRSALVHGNEKQPDKEEMRRRGAILEVFVGDLLAARAEHRTAPSPPEARRNYIAAWWVEHIRDRITRIRNAW